MIRAVVMFITMVGLLVAQNVIVSSTSPNNCSHRVLTLDLDSDVFSLSLTDEELDAEPFALPERQQLSRLLLRRMRSQGLSLAGIGGRVLLGVEATTIKQFLILSKDITKTNIGTSYVNVALGLNGERLWVDLTGFTQFRVLTHFNLVGAGTHNFRLVTDGATVVYTSPDQTGAGEKEIDSGWINLPGGVPASVFLRLEAKSTTAQDDPVYRRCILALR